MDTKDHLDRRNRGTEEAGVTEREAGSPTGTVTLASAVDFRQVVDPMQSPIRRFVLR